MRSLLWMSTFVLCVTTGCNKKAAEQAPDLQTPSDLAVEQDLASGGDLAQPDLFVAADMLSAAPVVTYHSPAGSDIGLTPTIYVQFSQPMDTVATTLALSPSATLGAATWTTGDTVVAFPVSSPLSYATTYTITVSGKNKPGVALTGTTTSVFSTIPVPDTTAPSITSFAPTDASTNVSVQPTITIGFSESIRASSLHVTTSPGAPLVWTLSADGSTATGALATCVGIKTCVPVSNFLLPFSSYTFNVAATDLAGNALTGKTSFALTTGASPLTDIRSTSPAFEEEGFPVANNVQIVFTKAVDISTLNSTSIDFFEEASVSTKVGFAVTLSTDKKTATINPTADLKNGIWYDLVIKPNAIALDGAPSTYIVPSTTGTFPATTPASYLMAFSTASDTTKPTVTSAGMYRFVGLSIATLVDGGAATTLANPAQGMRFTFSEPMGATTSSAFSLKTSAGSVPISVTWDNLMRNAYVALTDPFEYGVTYTLELNKTLAVDRAGNPIAASGKHVYTFTTPYVKELTIDPDAGTQLGPRTVYSVKPSVDEDPQAALWVGERNYYSTAANPAAAFCGLGTLVLGVPTITCAALGSTSKWLMAAQAATLVSFTLPAAVLDSPSIESARLTTGGVKRVTDTGSALNGLINLGPILVESVYMATFTDGHAIDTPAALSDTPAHLLIAGSAFEAQLRDKVVADIGRAATQANKSQVRIRATLDMDKDEEDDLLLIEQPRLVIGYLSETP